MCKTTNCRFSGTIIDKNGQCVYLKRVIYNNPVTVAIWSDDTRTVSKIHNGDTYNKEFGLVLCVLKKSIGTSNVNALIKDWLPEQESMFEPAVTLADVRKKSK